jgi:SAM-dependent methyltransferase
MTTWTAGYVAEIDYTHGFYRELTPGLLACTAALSNLASLPPLAKLRYCELGCGQGFSANIIAAANPGAEIHATDFNPSQIAGARQLAEEGGLSNVYFHEQAFADFADEPSLPDSFDIIALHGIYSWISAENRRHIVQFIRRKLRPGGLVYLSYNTLPGWAAAMPLRRLLVDTAATRTGPIAPRIDEGLALAESFMNAKAGYFAQNAALAARFEKMKGMSRAYLAHEYMNADWTPFYFADVVRELSEAKLTFLCSAHLLDAVDAINLTAEQQVLLNAVPDPIRRQGLRDYMINQQFRRDLFVKGGPLLPPAAAQERLLDQRFALSIPRADVPLKLPAVVGEVELQADTYVPLLDKFAAGPTTLRQMIADSAIASLGWARLRQALTVLVGAGHLQPCLPAQDEAKRAQRTKAFNAAVMRRADWSNELLYLASPVTGGGVMVDRFEQMFLAGHGQKGVDPAERAWAVISAQGQKIIKDGKTLETPEENLAELRVRLGTFSEKRLPILKQLGVA